MGRLKKGLLKRTGKRPVLDIDYDSASDGSVSDS